MRRENTFRIDYSCFPVKPSFEKVHGFCRSVLGLKKEEVARLQFHKGEQCAFVKVNDLMLAQKIVDEHDGRHEVELNGKKHKLRITMEDGSVEVKVHDLPENVSEEKIVEFLSRFGEVISIRELTWGDGYEFAGIPLGIWSARMLVRRNIDSWVNIDGQQAFILYKGQLQSCKHCKEQAHTGISCVQNKKLLVQKSYANVAKQAGSRPPPTKSAGAKPPISKPIGSKPPAPPPSSLDNFPALPNPTSQTEPTTSAARPESLSTSVDLTTFPRPSSQRAHSSSSERTTRSEESQKAIVALVDCFKKPTHTIRSQSKSDNGNGNETDDSSASTSSRRSTRGRPPGKKPRREDADDEQGEDNLS
ncbi:hypothetical protein RP20_CCG010496 [Aedes albopictus]|nr:hypothetical protein RP20_CCG010496 [Aedes albopictus]